MQRLILCAFIFLLHYVSADNSTNSCNSLLTCGECIQSPICAWCSEEDTNGVPRCFRPNWNLPYFSEHCSEEHVYLPTNTIYLHDSFKNQLKHSEIDLQLKVDEPLYFSVYFEKADDNTDLSFELNDNSSKYLNVRYISKCLGNYTTKNFQCNNSTSSRHIRFLIEVNLKTCPKQQDNAYKHFSIYLQNNTESVKVNVKMFCTCPCEQPGSMVRDPMKTNIDKYGQFSKPLALRMPPTDLSRPLLLYPSKEVTIFRTAAPLARVTQPIKTNLQKSMKSFVLLNDSTDAAFGITATDGIVYVKNITTLRKLPSNVRLTIHWINETIIQKDEIVVIITNGPNHKCHERGTSITDWDVCSYYKNKKKCNKACGISTGGSPGIERSTETCIWRGDTTNTYATCTSDISTCPDGICDSLEKLSTLVCPQDCTENVLFPLERNPKTGLGIEKGAGICFCYPSGGCLCEYVAPKKNKLKRITKKAPDVNNTSFNST